MQFTFEQLTQLMALATAISFFGFFSYRCGLRDKRKLITKAQKDQCNTAAANSHLKSELATIVQRAETSARAIELLNDELEAANLIKRRQLEAIQEAEDTADAYANLTAHMKSEIEALQAKTLNPAQRKTIKQAASQLLMTSQMMCAIKNKESAATQRTLAARLQNIISNSTDPSEKEAA